MARTAFIRYRFCLQEKFLSGRKVCVERQYGAARKRQQRGQQRAGEQAAAEAASLIRQRTAPVALIRVAMPGESQELKSRALASLSCRQNR